MVNPPLLATMEIVLQTPTSLVDVTAIYQYLWGSSSDVYQLWQAPVTIYLYLASFKAHFKNLTRVLSLASCSVLMCWAPHRSVALGMYPHTFQVHVCKFVHMFIYCIHFHPCVIDCCSHGLLSLVLPGWSQLYLKCTRLFIWRNCLRMFVPEANVWKCL